MPSAVVLLSSGLDSTVNLLSAIRNGFSVRKAITFNYGQRAAAQEIRQSQKICEILEVDHQVIELPWLGHMTTTALVNTQAIVPQDEDVQIDDYVRSLDTAKAVWVPNRNGVFLNIAAAFAEGLGAEFVIPGFNQEEAMTFPDNTADFLKALNHSFSYSTAVKVQTFCFTVDKNKSEIVQLGRHLNAPFELMWPCYFGGEEICRRCESCKRFLRALES